MSGGVYPEFHGAGGQGGFPAPGILLTPQRSPPPLFRAPGGAPQGSANLVLIFLAEPATSHQRPSPATTTHGLGSKPGATCVYLFNTHLNNWAQSSLLLIRALT